MAIIRTRKRADGKASFTAQIRINREGMQVYQESQAFARKQAAQTWLAAHPRYQVHFTPTSAFWLNLVERFFSTLSEKWIKRQAHTRVKDLEESIEYYLSTRNVTPRPFRWYRKAEGTLTSVGRAAEAPGRKI